MDIRDALKRLKIQLTSEQELVVQILELEQRVEELEEADEDDSWEEAIIRPYCG